MTKKKKTKTKLRIKNINLIWIVLALVFSAFVSVGLYKVFADNPSQGPYNGKTVTIETFGYEFGKPPKGMKYVTDVRNVNAGDFKQTETGLMPSVQKRVMAVPAAQKKLSSVEATWTPNLKNGDKVAFGCSRGHHRSVTLAVKYGDYLKKKGYHVKYIHRDITKRWKT